MKNPNSPIKKIQRMLKLRWSESDHPGAEARFQVILFAKDIAVFILLPVFAVFMFKTCENATSGNITPKRPRSRTQNQTSIEGSSSQIINFTAARNSGTGIPGVVKRAPGTLVKVRLLNKVETYSGAPVHAVIVDSSLGRAMRGATLIGEATPDVTFERINITFNLLKHPRKLSLAIPIAARGLSLNGTLGIVAKKKEGYFARAALGSADSALNRGQNSGAQGEGLKDVLLRAFATGLMQETNSATQVERNRANVLTISSSSVFYAELTDYFPGSK